MEAIDLSTVDGVLKAMLDASNNHQYQLLGALLIVMIVFIVRKLASNSTNKVATFIKSDIGGVSLSILTSAAGAAYTTMKGGAKLDLNLVLVAFINAAIASGIFTYVKHTKAAMPKRKNSAPPAVGIIFLPLLFTSAFALSSCAALKSALIDFGKCELGQVPSAVSNIMGDVEKTLGGEQVTWQGDMESLGKKVGMDAVNCAISAFLHNAAGFHGEMTAVAKTKIVRGRAWLADHGHAESAR